MDRNTFYCEYNGGYVTRYDKKSDDDETDERTDGDETAAETGTEQGAKYSGFERREEFLELSCELGEVEVYAEHEIADRYRETDSLEIVAGNPPDYGSVYNFSLVCWTKSSCQLMNVLTKWMLVLTKCKMMYRN